jgi:3-methyladenine DNA glycosylase AlkD
MRFSVFFTYWREWEYIGTVHGLFVDINKTHDLRENYYTTLI